jgi:outer membrane protein OmpA-like peptidoglycan-associated protein
MQAPRFAALILAAGMALPAAAQSVGGYPQPWFVYSVTPVCQLWQNGVQQCVPVALVGPAPAAVPAGLQPLTAAPSLPLPAAPMAAPSLPWPGAMFPFPFVQAAPGPAFVAPAAPSGALAAAPAKPVAAATPAPSAAPAMTAPARVEAVALPAPAATPAAELPPAPLPAAVAPAASPAGPAHAPGAILFAFDSADLDADGQQQLDAWLADSPRKGPIRITGHADRLGPAPYNQALSLRRARSVLRYLADKGVRPNDIRIAGKGERAPVVHCEGGPTPETRDCLAPNRRVEINPI